MSPEGSELAFDRLPDGYQAVPVSADQLSAPLRVCAVVRPQDDPMAGRLVTLREHLDARVHLGCLTDAAGRVQRWLEIWVQSLDHLANVPPQRREPLTNAVLDRRWSEFADALETLGPEGVLRTGWETRHPAPIWLDLDAGEPVHPTDPDGGGLWRLCTDEAILSGRSLPAYGASLHRYLHVPARGADSPMVPVSDEAPTNEHTRTVAEVFPGDDKTLALNPAGGLMLIRPYSPLDWEDVVAILSGAHWEGPLHGRTPLNLGGAIGALIEDDPVDPHKGRLFMGAHGRWGRLIEGLHLKLRLLADAVDEVGRWVRRSQRPLLGLSADSFQVRVAPPGAGLPYLWTARATLVDPGRAIELPIASSDEHYYVRAEERAVSVYSPADVGIPVSGRGSFRIREVLPESGGQVMLEGTLGTQERMDPARYDVVYLRVPMACGRVDLYGRLERDRALAAGEWRVRTLPQQLDEAQVAALRAAEGVPVRDVPFEVMPLLHSPCDLYALAVLGVRTLLVNAGNTLPVALDETLSLARQVAAAGEGEDPPPLADRIREQFEDDPRWFESLGPQRLTGEDLPAGDVFDLVPSALWFDTLAMLIRMFPGLGPDSASRDYGDVRPGGAHKAFDRAASDLQSLLTRTRSLIVIDWRFNREVHAVIRKFRAGTAEINESP